MGLSAAPFGIAYKKFGVPYKPFAHEITNNINKSDY